MEGGAVRSIGTADRSEGKGGVGEYGGESDRQRIEFGERGKRCDSIGGSETMEAWKSGDLGSNCCYEVLSRLSVGGAHSCLGTGMAYGLREFCELVAVHRAPGIFCHHHDIGHITFQNITREL